MNTEVTESTPYGLFRYLYNHYQVRYPEMHMSMGAVLTNDVLDAVDAIDSSDLQTHLAKDSWLIGIGRPDMADSVQLLWDTMTPLARGDYLAGFTELTYLSGQQDEARLAFIKEQVNQQSSVEFTAETACEIGCALLAMGLEDTFANLLHVDIPWEQEIDRASAQDARRWKTISRLSKRVIDIFLEAALILKRPNAATLLLGHGANPDILIWQLERSSNALYPALSYAIKNSLAGAVDALLEHGANPRGSDSAPMRSPLALAFQQCDFPLIQRLLTAGASLEDGMRYSEAPTFYGMGSPVEWVSEQLSELLELLPLEAKPLFHSPHAQPEEAVIIEPAVIPEPIKAPITAEETKHPQTSTEQPSLEPKVKDETPTTLHPADIAPAFPEPIEPVARPTEAPHAETQRRAARAQPATSRSQNNRSPRHVPQDALDVEARSREFVQQALEAQGYTVTQLEQKNPGYDIHARRGGEVLFVEVKGSKDQTSVVHLTPTELKTYREAGNGYTWQLWHVSCLAVDAGERPEICIYQTLPESALSPEVYTLDLAACQRSPYESTPNIVS